jgi:hypothetical protein
MVVFSLIKVGLLALRDTSHCGFRCQGQVSLGARTGGLLVDAANSLCKICFVFMQAFILIILMNGASEQDCKGMYGDFYIGI